uniref:Uncharacterized protein n=1 Tax=Anguilla anguilla TaxID=7936 RepID=A0A0E9SG19_ANGAN
MSHIVWLALLCILSIVRPYWGCNRISDILNIRENETM